MPDQWTYLDGPNQYGMQKLQAPDGRIVEVPADVLAARNRGDVEAGRFIDPILRTTGEGPAPVRPIDETFHEPRAKTTPSWGATNGVTPPNMGQRQAEIMAASNRQPLVDRPVPFEHKLGWGDVNGVRGVSLVGTKLLLGPKSTSQQMLEERQQMLEERRAKLLQELANLESLTKQKKGRK